MLVLGTIPFFEDGDHKMTESCGIPQYLVTKYGPSTLGVSPDEPDYGAYINYIFQADATLTFPQTVVLRYTLQEPGRADDAANDYAKWYIARLRALDNTLADGREFLVADRFTIADICITYALFLGTTLSTEGNLIADRYQPQTRAYMDRMMARPGWIKSMQAQSVSAKEFEAEHGPPQLPGAKPRL
jgi:glutathione S-transferase